MGACSSTDSKSEVSRKSLSRKPSVTEQSRRQNGDDSASKANDFAVNPMKSYLSTRASGAFVPWSHVSKVIQALDIVQKEINPDDIQMTDTMIRQCMQLLRDSPYILHKDDAMSSRHGSVSDMHSSARQNMKDSLLHLKAQEYGQATNEVKRWISNMVQLQLETPENLLGQEEGDGTPSRRSRAKSLRKMSLPQDLLSVAVKSISANIETSLLTISEWDFDIFEYFDLTGDVGLSVMVIFVCKKYDILKKLNVKEDTLTTFLHTVQQTYNTDVPYHNHLHAGDVVATSFCLYTNRTAEHIKVSTEELFCLIVACACHDVGHPGTNNQFHIDTESDLALLYNDRHVLENFHISTTFRILKREGHNFLKGSVLDRVRFRHTITDLITYTDMSLHTKILDQLLPVTNAIFEAPKSGDFRAERKPLDDVEMSNAQREVYLHGIIHMADISNPGKPKETMLEWSNRLYNEFYLQGDRERSLGLTVSPICDRTNPTREASSVGFSNYIVRPIFLAMRPYSNICVEAIDLCDKNVVYWQSLLDNKRSRNGSK